MSLNAKMQNFADFIQRRTQLIYHLASLKFDEFIAHIEEANQICDRMPFGKENEQIRLLPIKDSMKTIFWKLTVRIEFQKINTVTNETVSSRTVTLKQFMLLYRELKTLQTMESVMTMSTLLERAGVRAGSGDDDLSEMKAVEDPEECIICLERQPDVILPCAHAYCHTCIQQWLSIYRDPSEESHSCPICRGELQKVSDAWQLMEPPDPDESRAEMTKVLMGLVERTGSVSTSSAPSEDTGHVD